MNSSRPDSLHIPPAQTQGFAHATSLAAKMLDGSLVRRLEDGPYGGTPLMIGEELAGETITATRGADGESWGVVRLADNSLAQAAHALSRSKLWLPGSASSVGLQIGLLGDIGKLGWLTGISMARPREGPLTRQLRILRRPTLPCGTTKPDRKHGMVCLRIPNCLSDQEWKAKLLRYGPQLAALI